MDSAKDECNSQSSDMAHCSSSSGRQRMHRRLSMIVCTRYSEPACSKPTLLLLQRIGLIQVIGAFQLKVELPVVETTNEIEPSHVSARRKLKTPENF